MSKSILVIDTPKSCEECRCSLMVYGKLHCPPRDTIVSKGERDCSCPLIPAPKKIESYDATRIEAWNECVEKFTGQEGELSR